MILIILNKDCSRRPTFINKKMIMSVFFKCLLLTEFGFMLDENTHLLFMETAFKKLIGFGDFCRSTDIRGT